MQDMFKQLQTLLQEYTDDNTIAVERGTVLRGAFGLTSFDLASLLCEAEDRFHVEIPDRVVAALVTAGDLADYLSLCAQGEKG